MAEGPAGGFAPPAGRFLGERFAPLVVFVPGFLFGVHVGGLLFFLNPSLPFEAGPWLRATGIYGLLVGLGTGLVLLPFVRGRPRRALRLLPWGISVALGAAALLDSFHASHLAFYLPAGINERLLKASLWLALAALVTFYTALLHSLHRRPYGIRSRVAFWLLPLVTVLSMVERREAFEPRPERALPTRIEASSRPTLLVVGIDSATLDVVLPLAEQGRLPFFSELLREGAYGRLESFAPSHPGPSWTTVATGKYPYEHGVLGGRVYPVEFLAEGAELRLVPEGLGFELWGLPGLRGRPEQAARARRVRTLWELLPLLDVPSGVVAWPALALGAQGPAFAFEHEFFGERFDPALATPEALAEQGWIFRVAVEDLDPRHLDRFEEEPPRPVLEALTADAWRQDLATVLVDHVEVRALFVRLPGLAEVSARYFTGYSEWRLEGRQAPELERAAEILGTYYSLLDSFLAELWDAVPEPRLMAVVSAYGVDELSDLERAVARLRGEPPLGGELDEGADGVLMLRGEAIRPETLITGARDVDVAPTLLYGLGLPVARDFDGRVLTEAFRGEFLERQPLTFVPSYENLPAPAPPAGPGAVPADPGS